LIWDILGVVGVDFNFEVNGIRHYRYYLLVKKIYPWWSCFVFMIHEPQGEKRKHFAQLQETTRKDVECCFGVLQAKW
jgi:hypothetical protein